MPVVRRKRGRAAVEAINIETCRGIDRSTRGRGARRGRRVQPREALIRRPRRKHYRGLRRDPFCGGSFVSFDEAVLLAASGCWGEAFQAVSLFDAHAQHRTLNSLQPSRSWKPFNRRAPTRLRHVMAHRIGTARLVQHPGCRPLGNFVHSKCKLTAFLADIIGRSLDNY